MPPDASARGPPIQTLFAPPTYSPDDLLPQSPPHLMNFETYPVGIPSPPSPYFPVVELQPRRISPKESLALRARNALEAEQPFEALDSCNAFIGTWGANADILLCRGMAFEKVYQYGNALQDMNLVLALSPQQEEALIAMQRIRRKQLQEIMFREGEAPAGGRVRDIGDRVSELVDTLADSSRRSETQDDRVSHTRECDVRILFDRHFSEESMSDVPSDSDTAVQRSDDEHRLGRMNSVRTRKRSPVGANANEGTNSRGKSRSSTPRGPSRHGSSSSSSPAQRSESQNKSYPSREGAPPCQYWLKTGKCNYGSRCKFDHPPRHEELVNALNRRDCFDYVQTGTCP